VLEGSNSEEEGEVLEESHSVEEGVGVGGITQ
jgi:hypothetical protein